MANENTKTSGPAAAEITALNERNARLQAENADLRQGLRYLSIYARGLGTALEDVDDTLGRCGYYNNDDGLADKKRWFVGNDVCSECYKSIYLMGSASDARQWWECDCVSRQPKAAEKSAAEAAAVASAVAPTASSSDSSVPASAAAPVAAAAASGL